VECEEQVDPDLIQLRDIVQVLLGTKIPVDGDILLGETTVDESILMGESIPIEKRVGDKVSSTTLNVARVDPSESEIWNQNLLKSSSL